MEADRLYRRQRAPLTILEPETMQLDLGLSSVLDTSRLAGTRWHDGSALSRPATRAYRLYSLPMVNRGKGQAQRK